MMTDLTSTTTPLLSSHFVPAQGVNGVVPLAVDRNRIRETLCLPVMFDEFESSTQGERGAK